MHKVGHNMTKTIDQYGKRAVLFSIGCLATVLALIGVWTPGLPTTPFLLVALWAFSGSSQRLHTWLTSAPVFGAAMKHVKLFQEKRVVKKEVRIVAQLCAWSSFLVMLLLYGPRSYTTMIVFAAALLCSISMWMFRAKRVSDQRS